MQAAPLSAKKQQSLCKEPPHARDTGRPENPQQFFWIDDAFGATQLDWQATVDWNGAFAHIRGAIRRGARFVFTSRDYIYRNARNLLKESALPVVSESQVVIRVEQLTKDEREQILYNLKVRRMACD